MTFQTSDLLALGNQAGGNIKPCIVPNYVQHSESNQLIGTTFSTYCFLLQGTRNTGMKLKNKNIANPTGLLLASCDMLDYLG